MVAVHGNEFIHYDILDGKYVYKDDIKPDFFRKLDKSPIVRAIPLHVNDYIHLTEEQYKEAKQYMELKETGDTYYNYVITKLYSEV